LRILYFSSRECWPLNTGARLRDFYQARELARRSTLTYLGMRNPRDPASVAPPVEAFASALVEKDPGYSPGKLIRGLIGPTPVNVLNYWTERMAAELRRLLDGEPFDSVQVEGVHLAPYLPAIRAARSHPAIVGDWHNIESEIMRRYSENAVGLPRRLYARRTAGLLEKTENRLLRGCDAHSVASRREMEKLSRRMPEARIAVVENGVDVASHSDQEIEDAYRRANGNTGGPRRDLLFVGSMDYHANIDAAVRFARELWPALRERMPQLRFVIVGRSPAPEVRALASISGVVVTGTVDDVRPYYREAVAEVVPLRVGSGTRLKILEAMAAGVPIVSTALGAEGLEVTDGRDILLAEAPQAMLGAIQALANSEERRCEIAAAARELVRARYDWPILGAKLFEIHCAARERSK
jgi:glycosyltransferase involved in cell wall biosynthesis